MKFKITMKDPDGFADAIQDAAKESVTAMENIDEDEEESLIESRQKKFSELCREWFKYSEYLTVEVDTEAKSIAVVKA